MITLEMALSVQLQTVLPLLMDEDSPGEPRTTPKPSPAQMQASTYRCLSFLLQHPLESFSRLSTDSLFLINTPNSSNTFTGSAFALTEIWPSWTPPLTSSGLGAGGAQQVSPAATPRAAVPSSLDPASF